MVMYVGPLGKDPFRNPDVEGGTLLKSPSRD